MIIVEILAFSRFLVWRGLHALRSLKIQKPFSTPANDLNPDVVTVAMTLDQHSSTGELDFTVIIFVAKDLRLCGWVSVYFIKKKIK